MNPILKTSLLVLGGAVVSGGITWAITRKVETARHLKTTAKLVANSKFETDNLKKEVDELKLRCAAMEEAARRMEWNKSKPAFFILVNDILAEMTGYNYEEEKKELFAANPNPPGFILSNEHYMLAQDGIELERASANRSVDMEDVEEDPDAEYDPHEPLQEDTDDSITPVEPPSQIHYREKPYVISQDECGDGENDIECLVYYDGDGILATEGEEVLNIMDTIGDEALEHFEDNLVYVRNNHLGLDYEVRWDPGSYAQNVMGIDYLDTPSVEKFKKRREQRDEDS